MSVQIDVLFNGQSRLSHPTPSRGGGTERRAGGELEVCGGWLTSLTHLLAYEGRIVPLRPAGVHPGPALFLSMEKDVVLCEKKTGVI